MNSAQFLLALLSVDKRNYHIFNIYDNQCNPKAKIIIFLKCNTGYESVIELLIQNGADINAVNDLNNSALILALDTDRGNHLKITAQHSK